MEEGRLVKWMKAEGDAVKSGDVLAEVETDKAIMELVARGDGVLRKRLLDEGGTSAVGTLIASLVLWLAPVPVAAPLAAASEPTWALILLAGLMGTAGHLLFILAVARAPMAVLMPFTYAQIAFASFTGWLAFGHVPDGIAFAGMVVVAACGAAAVWLNFREASVAAAGADANSAATQ